MFWAHRGANAFTTVSNSSFITENHNDTDLQKEESKKIFQSSNEVLQFKCNGERALWSVKTVLLAVNPRIFLFAIKIHIKNSNLTSLYWLTAILNTYSYFWLLPSFADPKKIPQI